MSNKQNDIIIDNIMDNLPDIYEQANTFQKFYQEIEPAMTKEQAREYWDEQEGTCHDCGEKNGGCFYCKMD